MSFLFTFSLPRLPFNNPFSTQNPEQHAGQWRRGSHAQREDVPRLTSNGNRDLYQRRDLPRLSINPNHSGYNQNGNGQAINDDTGLDNPRKRKNPDLNYTDIYTPNDYAPRPSGHHSRSRYSLNNRGPRDVQFKHNNVSEGYREDVEGDHPATKRRRVGIAETLISTVVSVAIISTAVGYTAYKLWKDKGRVPDRQMIEHEEGYPVPDDVVNPQTPRKRATDESRLDSLISSPPPPYNVEEEEERNDDYADYRRKAPRRHRYQGEPYQQYYPRSATGRPPMSQIHRALGPSVELGEKMRHKEVVSDPVLLSGGVSAWTKQREQIGFQQFSESEEEDMEVQDSYGSEELEARSRRIEQQIDSMSQRLQQLIADGSRALRTEYS